MNTLYFKIEEDKEGIYGDYLLLLSAHPEMFDSFDYERIGNLPCYELLECETENMYSFSEDALDFVKETLEDFNFKESLKLKSFFSEDENSITEKEETTGVEENIKLEELLIPETCEEENKKEKESIGAVTSSTITGTIIKIKDWKDINCVEMAYSYLTNYKRIMGENYDPLLFSGDIKFKNKDLYEVLINNNVAKTESFTNIKKFYPEKLSSKGHKHIEGVFNVVSDVVLFMDTKVLLNEVSPETKAIEVYNKNKDYYDNLYFYWMGLYSQISLAHSKALLFGTLENVKNLDSTKVNDLFEFEFMGIPKETKEVQLLEEDDLTINSLEINSLGEENFSQENKEFNEKYVWGLVEDCDYKTVGKLSIKSYSRLYIKIVSRDYFSKNHDIEKNLMIDGTILNYFKIRGIDTKNSPVFEVPSYVNPCVEDVKKLLSGIENLSFSSELQRFLMDGSVELENESSPNIPELEEMILDEKFFEDFKNTTTDIDYNDK